MTLQKNPQSCGSNAAKLFQFNFLGVPFGSFPNLQSFARKKAKGFPVFQLTLVRFFSCIALVFCFSGCKNFTPILNSEKTLKTIENNEVDLNEFLKNEHAILMSEKGQPFQYMWIEDGKIKLKTERIEIQQEYNTRPMKFEIIDKMVLLFGMFFGLVILLSGLYVFFKLRKP